MFFFHSQKLFNHNSIYLEEGSLSCMLFVFYIMTHISALTCCPQRDPPNICLYSEMVSLLNAKLVIAGYNN